MKPLDEAIRLRMVWGRHLNLDAPYFRQLLKCRGAELRSSIGRDDSGYAEVGNPPISKRVAYTLGGDINEWNGDWPTGEAIHCSE